MKVNILTLEQVEEEFNFNMKYFDELKKSMELLAEHPDTIFIGQAVEYEGTGMSNTLKGISSDKRLELPVAEEFQMGLANGLALAGKIPVSIFPRWNFLLVGMNQLVNHLDKIPDFSEFKTKVIIRTAIGSERPLHPQCQHVGDYSNFFSSILKNVEVIRLDEPEQIFASYHKALTRNDNKSTILVEWGDFYNEK
jgi:pyruvate/2-oxoglutarate/acetoin dehydrogenase E1 component